MGKKVLTIEMMINDHSSLVIAFYSGAKDSLKKIDFSFLNLTVLNMNSQEFKAYLESMDRAADFMVSDNFVKWNQTFGDWGQENPLVFVPIDKNVKVERPIFDNIHELLTLMFPTDFTLTGFISFTGSESEGYLVATEHNLIDVGRKRKGRILDIQEDKIGSANEFFKTYFANIIKLKEFHVAFDSYRASFFLNMDMGVINLCIAIEALTTASNEIAHQLSRLCAVLNSDSKEFGRIIYTNMKKHYELRSRIVHGTKQETKILEKHYYQLEALVSSTLIEILYMDMDSKDRLRDYVNETGYGEKLRRTKPRLTFNSALEQLVLTPFQK